MKITISCVDNCTKGISSKVSAVITIMDENTTLAARLLATISSITKNLDCMSVTFTDGANITVPYIVNVQEAIYRNNVNKHLQLFLKVGVISAERFVRICDDIVVCHYTPCLDNPNLVCNVMDNSGNFIFAEKVGIKINLHPDNSEWCLRGANSTHYGMFSRIYKITGGIYRVSAKDDNLKEFVRKCSNMKKSQAKEILLDYLTNGNYKRVK